MPSSDTTAVRDRGLADRGLRRDGRTPDRRPTADKLKLVDRPWIKPDGCPPGYHCGDKGPITGCKVDADCVSNPIAKFCSIITGQCVECRVDAECSTNPTAKYCNFMTGQCFGCKANTDCASTFWQPVCDTTMGTCVECMTAADCSLSWRGHVCDTTTHSCRCVVNADCSNVICDVAAGHCGCMADSECNWPPTPMPTATTPFCDTTAHVCLQCKTNADCSAMSSLPPHLRGTVCDTTVPQHTCGCSANTDCSTSTMGPLCDTANRVCHCAANADCILNALGKVCATVMGSCSCAQDADCPSGKKCTGVNPWSLAAWYPVKICQ